MHFFEVVTAYYNATKPDDLDREILERLMGNLDRLDSAGIYTVAELCYVSPTTISRLSKKLGYRAYSQFRRELLACISGYDRLNRYVPFEPNREKGDVLRSYRRLMTEQTETFFEKIDMEEIDRLVEVVHNSGRVNFYTRGVNFAERYFQEDIIMDGHPSAVFTVPVIQKADAETLDEDSLVIMIIPDIHDMSQHEEIAKIVKKRKAKLMLITDSKTCSLIPYADYCHTFDGYGSSIDDYHFAMFTNVLSINFREKYID